MTLSIDLFWSFRSPYSYLATPRLTEMQREYDLNINVRPVYPLAVRSGEFFGQVNPQWIPYLLRDTFRLSQMLDLPYKWPRPDPVVVDPMTRAATPNQPYIHRLTRLGCAAAETPHGLDFLNEVSRTIWSGENENWHQGDHLAKAAARADLDLAELDRKDRSRSRQIRSHHSGESESACGRGPLGRADDGVQRRTVLRTGPSRRPVVAVETERPSRPGEIRHETCTAIVIGCIVVAH